MAVRFSRASTILIIYVCILGALWVAGWERVPRAGLDVLLIAVGVRCITNPKRGNFSLSLALLLIGMGGFNLPRDLLLLQSRLEFLFLSTTVSAAFVLYGIAWLKKGKLAFSLLGAMFVVIGLSCHAAGLWLFSFLQGTTALRFR